MCGRFTSTAPAQTVAHYFDAAMAEQLQLPMPSWNVAPTNDVYVVV